MMTLPKSLGASLLATSLLLSLGCGTDEGSPERIRVEPPERAPEERIVTAQADVWSCGWLSSSSTNTTGGCPAPNRYPVWHTYIEGCLGTGGRATSCQDVTPRDNVQPCGTACPVGWTQVGTYSNPSKCQGTPNSTYVDCRR
ncbi:MAG TPA: hypothetical protein VFZ09_28220 [Archangium sp.]|uniref:hypothetical protein n=1 Tax=Archangium sp. TaxID=1872627 RepID=UPI002E307E19|nr:hypothetical protein [Archangium sp.]HEX5750149.1 hypothetical protein [Archangium sp.]